MKTLLTLAMIALLAAPASPQTALQIARTWNDSLIKPRQPINTAIHHAVDSVIINAADIETFLRSLPGFGEGKVLKVQANALIWAVGSIVNPSGGIFSAVFSSQFQ